jgi:hypothetical protein
MSAAAHRSRREFVAGLLGSAQERRYVTGLLAAEQVAAEVYRRAAAAQVMSPAARSLADRLGAQERSHAASLARLSGMGPARVGTMSDSAVETGLRSLHISAKLGALDSEKRWFTLLENLESGLEGAYYKAIRHLTRPDLATLAAQILASEAQHSVLLFRFRNPMDIKLDVAVGLVKGNAGG